MHPDLSKINHALLSARESTIKRLITSHLSVELVPGNYNVSLLPL